MKNSVLLAAVAVIALASAGGVTAAPVPTTLPVSLSNGDRAIVENKVLSALKDPTVDELGEMTARKGDDGNTYVCGLLKIGDSTGKYIGDIPYVGMLASGQFLVVGMGDSDQDVAAVTALCSEYGMSMD